MNILQVISSADLRGGGPIESVRQSGLRLQELGHVVEVVSLDEPQAAGVQNLPFPLHALGPSSGGYGYNSRWVQWFMTHAGRYDLIVINGLWQYHSFGAWRALRRLHLPYVIFTHGMLDPWFKRTYPLKHLKKWLYWPWADFRVLRDAAAVLFTCEEERLLARESFWLYRARERVVAFGTSAPPPQREALASAFLAQHPDLQGKRLLLYLGRIHEKKGCDLLIDAFADVATHVEGLHLVMAGPDQSGWVSTLQSQAEQHGLSHRIHWTGMLSGDTKWGAFYAAEAFVLPSHQENFGIAVAEALGCGLPVLISNKVNIWREVQQGGAGLVEDDTVDGTRALLERWIHLNGAERKDMGQQARQLFDERFTVNAMVDSLLQLAPLTQRPVAA